MLKSVYVGLYNLKIKTFRNCTLVRGQELVNVRSENGSLDSVRGVFFALGRWFI